VTGQCEDPFSIDGPKGLRNGDRQHDLRHGQENVDTRISDSPSSLCPAEINPIGTPHQQRDADRDARDHHRYGAADRMRL